jgi:hypothetical protein
LALYAIFSFSLASNLRITRLRRLIEEIIKYNMSSAVIARTDHLKKAITPEAVEKGNIYLGYTEVHRHLKQKQIAAG